MLLARIACSNRQWKERKVRSCVRLWGSRESTMELCSLSYLGGCGRVLYGESLGDTRVYMPTRACSVHARSDRTTDGRYSIAVCRICSLCRDHILVLIRAPDKIALCYRGSCLRDPRESEREREIEREPSPVCFYLRPAPRFTLPFAFRLGLIRESSCEKKIVRFRSESRRIRKRVICMGSG